MMCHNIVELEDHFGMMEAPQHQHLQQPGSASSTPYNDILPNARLDETWRIDAEALRCRLQDGQPKILGEGI